MLKPTTFLLLIRRARWTGHKASPALTVSPGRPLPRPAYGKKTWLCHCHLSNYTSRNNPASLGQQAEKENKRVLQIADDEAEDNV